jgi:hypothetical protein
VGDYFGIGVGFKVFSIIALILEHLSVSEIPRFITHIQNDNSGVILNDSEGTYSDDAYVQAGDISSNAMVHKQAVILNDIGGFLTMAHIER